MNTDVVERAMSSDHEGRRDLGQRRRRRRLRRYKWTPSKEALRQMRRTLYPLSLLVLLWGCSVFNGAREPRVHELRRSLDYPVHDASFAT